MEKGVSCTATFSLICKAVRRSLGQGRGDFRLPAFFRQGATSRRRESQQVGLTSQRDGRALVGRNCSAFIGKQSRTLLV